MTIRVGIWGFFIGHAPWLNGSIWDSAWLFQTVPPFRSLHTGRVPSKVMLYANNVQPLTIINSTENLIQLLFLFLLVYTYNHSKWEISGERRELEDLRERDGRLELDPSNRTEISWKCWSMKSLVLFSWSLNSDAIDILHGWWN